MRTAPDVSIVTVSYNTSPYLERALRAVEEHHGNLQIEHWVVDNGSSDGTTEMIERKFPKVKLISSATNLGPGRARNLVIPKCTAPYILNIDSDVIIQPGTIEYLINYMENNPN